MIINSLFYALIALDILAMLVGIFAEINVTSAFNKYKDIDASAGITGRELAEKILSENEIYDIKVQEVAGNLSDNYNHREKTLNLSSSIYNGTSIASLAVAAHECGHAIQYKKGYMPIKLRTAVIMLSNFVSKLFVPFLIVSLIIAFITNFTSGSIYFFLGLLGVYGLAVVVNLATLPVEFDASRRAMQELKSMYVLSSEDIVGARKMLTAAALTYVAGLVVSLIYFFRYLLIILSLYDNR